MEKRAMVTNDVCKEGLRGLNRLVWEEGYFCQQLHHLCIYRSSLILLRTKIPKDYIFWSRSCNLQSGRHCGLALSISCTKENSFLHLWLIISTLWKPSLPYYGILALQMGVTTPSCQTVEFDREGPVCDQRRQFNFKFKCHWQWCRQVPTRIKVLLSIWATHRSTSFLFIYVDRRNGYAS